MKKLMTIMKPLLLILGVVMLGQAAMAAEPGVAVSKVLLDSRFKGIVTWGVALYAGWLWFRYFADFDPGSAFTKIITPAIMTFLAFKWDWLLQQLMA